MSTSLSNTLTVGPGTCECVYAYHSEEGCEGGGYKTTEKEKKKRNKSLGECLDFLNKMGRKRHASEYQADSGTVSSTSTDMKMLEGLLRERNLQADGCVA